MAKKKSALNIEPLGESGLRQSGGVIVEEYQKELRGRKGAATFREMYDSDSICGAIIFAVSQLMRNAEWMVAEADETPESEEAKEFVEGVLFEDMDAPWSDVIDEISSMFVYGFAPLEIVWKIRDGRDNPDLTRRSKFDDGKVGIRSLALRAQTSVSRWIFDPETNELAGLWQQPLTGHEIPIPIERLLLFRTTRQKNNPEGRSILRTAYRSWFYKKRIEEFEAIGIERDLAGMPIAYIPEEYFNRSADAEQRATYEGFKKLVTRLRRNETDGILMPSGRDAHGQLKYELKLLSTGGSRQFPTDASISRHNRQMAMSVLADFILLGQDKVGSFALSSDKTALFASALGAFMQSVCDVFNRVLLPRLWEINGLEYEVMPQLRHGDIENADIEALGRFITALAGAGMPLFPDADLEDWLRDQMGAPPRPEDAGLGEDDLPAMPQPVQTLAPPRPEPDPKQQPEKGGASVALKKRHRGKRRR